MNRNCHTALEEMSEACRALGAEVRYYPEDNYLTAMVWKGWDWPYDEGPARAIQRQIQEKAAQYPGLVCYCFDPFSTLVYAV